MSPSLPRAVRGRGGRPLPALPLMVPHGAPGASRPPPAAIAGAEGVGEGAAGGGRGGAVRGGEGGRRGVRRRKAPSWALLWQRRGLGPAMAREEGAPSLSPNPAETRGRVLLLFIESLN